MKKHSTGTIILEGNQLENGYPNLNGWVQDGDLNLIKDFIDLHHDELQISSNVVIGSAIFHPKYSITNIDPETHRRYFLKRVWDSKLETMTIFMMNPSVADGVVGDPTVDFMIRYAMSNNFGSIIVINTSPFIKGSGVNRNDFVSDETNWFYISHAIQLASIVILGWGESGQKYGVPVLKRNHPIQKLLLENKNKLRVFDYGNLSVKKWYPKHPHPQMQNQRFPLNHKLKIVKQEDLIALSLI